MITPIDPMGRAVPTEATASLLRVQGLSVAFPTEDGMVRAVRGVHLDVGAGEVVGIVGESGSGKSVTALAMMRLLSRRAHVEGSIELEGRELLTLSERSMRSVRGSDVAMIFQDPMTALNPVFTVGDQIVEALRLHHKGMSKQAAWERSVELLDLVGVPEPRRRAAQYPHEFSGGMRQRAMIAMAVANRPKLLIADEPTTALDVTIQAQVMEVIADVQRAVGSALLLITHDLGLVAGIAHRIVVMYAGQVVESAWTDDVFYRSANPYTRGLLASMPGVDGEVGARLPSIPGLPPSALRLPTGCAFSPRCDHADAACSVEPELRPVGDAHTSRCHHAEAVRR